MNSQEYRDWFASLMAHFPSVQQWWERLPEETRRVNSSDWREVLERESLADCETALKQIKQGNAELWPEFSREMLGARVAQIARSIRFERESCRDRKPSQEGTRAHRRPRMKLMGRYQRLCELRKQGIGQEEAAKIARREFLPQSEGHCQRFSCSLCRDSGFVECWHPETITRVIRGEDTRSKYTYSIPCYCERGRRFIDHKGDKDSRHSFEHQGNRFSLDTHCIVGNFELPPSEVELIRQWAGAVKPENRRGPIEIGRCIEAASTEAAA